MNDAINGAVVKILNIEISRTINNRTTYFLELNLIIQITGLSLTSASACLNSFPESYEWSGGCAGGGAKFTRLHEDL